MKNTELYLKKLESYGLHYIKKYEITPDSTALEIWSEDTIASLANILNEYAGKCSLLQSENDRLQANIFVKEKNYKMARMYFEDAIKVNNNFLAYRDYAQFLNNELDLDKALTMCNRAIELKPDREWPRELKQLIINNMEKNK
jgi:tetratricopeptide (TPR) repeat protein